MGWSFHWVSSFENDFNHDYGVSFTPEEREAEGFWVRRRDEYVR